ncbi:MAG: hypothetical protein JW990_01075 [Thermoleophilia bacterium]|nr:hypothetical protein [Thermoleophilia bacterium]
MTDDTRQPPEEPAQLALDATVTGPGMRTADPYEPGTQLKIEGERGIFIYRYATVSSTGLVSLHLTREGMARAVRPDQARPMKRPRQRMP